MGPRGEAILDYTIAHALEAGFQQVVIVVRPETERSVRDHLRTTAGVLESVDLVVQRGDPEGPAWGTGYAVLAAAASVARPFAVANADDYYGRGSLSRLAAHLSDPSRAGEWAVVAFDLVRTLSPHGGVSRAVCTSGPDGFLDSVREATGVTRGEDGVIRNDAGSALAPDTPVSMNLWGFGPEIFDVLAELAERREAHRSESGLGPTAGAGEFRLPDAVDEAMRRGSHRVRMLRTDERWVGLTFPGDLGETRRVLSEAEGGGSRGR